MKFHYKAIRQDGEVFEGITDTVDRFAVYAEVRKNGGSALSVEEVGGVASSLNLSFLHGLFGSVHTADKIIFARNLATMLSAGLPLSRALSVLERQTRNAKLKEVVVTIDESIKKGKSLHEAMEEHPDVFPKLFSAMVKAGEESGKLAESLRGIAEQTERSHNLTKKIRGAMMYPGIILTAMVVIGVAMLVYVVPTLTNTFKEFHVELPLTTRIIIGVSDWLTAHFILAVVGLGVAVTGFVVGLRTKKGRRIFEFTLLHTPLIKGLVKETNTARVARTLSSLLSSGVEVMQAFSITREVIQNSYFRAVLVEAERQIEKGNQMAKAFSENENLFPPLMSELVAVGEETGQLSSMLLQVAEFYESEVDQKTQNMSTIIEPFLMIVIGIAVGFFALSVISPIYSLSNTL